MPALCRGRVRSRRQAVSYQPFHQHRENFVEPESAANLSAGHAPAAIPGQAGPACDGQSFAGDFFKYIVEFFCKFFRRYWKPDRSKGMLHVFPEVRIAPQAPFIRRWLEQYCGRKFFWNIHGLAYLSANFKETPMCRAACSGYIPLSRKRRHTFYIFLSFAKYSFFILYEMKAIFSIIRHFRHQPSLSIL